MARIMAISSQVASGHVGLSAITPVLQAFGHTVIALPTIILSNHPGHAYVSSQRLAADALDHMVDAIGRNGWLADVSFVLTGYLPTPEHVAFAKRTFERVAAARAASGDPSHASAARLICDPVLGDHPKGLYIADAAASAIRDQLVPMAELITPNAFELGWLADRPIASLEDAQNAVDRIATEAVITSVPFGPRRISGQNHAAEFDQVAAPGQVTALGQRIANLCLSPRSAAGGKTNAECVDVQLRENVPNGTGDAFAAAYVGYSALHHDAADGTSTALRTVTDWVQALVDTSQGQPELDLAHHLPALARIAAQATAADKANWS